MLWDFYETKEEEGLERFENALSKHSEFTEVKAPELDKLSELIEQTNAKLRMKYKREHYYDLELYEEQLYKEVVFDARPKKMQLDQQGRKD